MSISSEVLFINTIRNKLTKGEAIESDLQTLLENPENVNETLELLQTILLQLPTVDFERCVTHSLSIILDRSKDMPEKQMCLALVIGKRYFLEVKLKEAMRYCAIAHNIARWHGFETAYIEEVEAQIFLSFLDLQYPRIQKEFDAFRNNPIEFKKKVEDLLNLCRFCRMGESRRKVANLFQVPQKIKNNLNPSAQKQHQVSRDALMRGISLESQEVDWIFISEEYRLQLQKYRDSFKTKLDLGLREKQKYYTQNFKVFFDFLIKDAFILLGSPPCSYLFCSMGSLSREEPTPYSDLEWVLLIEHAQERTYFETLVAFLELQCISIGETPAQHTPLFSSCPSVEGFHLDHGSHFLIGTPKEIVDTHISLHIEPRTLAYTIHHLAPLNGNEDLFKKFLDRKQIKMKSLSRKLNTDQKQTALMLLQSRKEEFFHNQKSNSENNISLKRDYIEPLFHLLRDLGFYYGLEECNTLDLLDVLPLFSYETTSYLKNIVSRLYELRIETDDPNRLEVEEKERIGSLLFCPLYEVLLEHFPPQEIMVDLFELKLRRIISKKKYRTRESMAVFCRQIAGLGLQEETIIKYYQILSQHINSIELLRYLFLSFLEAPLVQKLEKIPNLAGKRYIYKKRQQQFFVNFSKLVDDTKVIGAINSFSVLVASPFCKLGYLRSEIIDEIFDANGNIKKTIGCTNSRVTRFRNAFIDFHFKQKPSNPQKESPFHPGREHAASQLMFRLFGRGTSMSELFEFVIETGSKLINRYLVLISETVEGDAVDLNNPPNVDPIQLSELFLSIPLLLPGDMRTANLVATSSGELISVDNDVSWVKPYTKESCNLYTILPFLYPDFVLDSRAIDAFLRLKPIPLLLNWLEELCIYNNTLLGYPSIRVYEEVSRTFLIDCQLYTSTCTFQKGTGAQLISQFFRLQEFLQKNQHRPIQGVEMLRTIISIDNNQLLTVGEVIFDKYRKAQGLAMEVGEKVKWVTGRKIAQSVSMTQSQASFFDNLPKNVQEIKDYSPEHAYEEIEKLAALNFNGFFFQSEGRLASLERGMEGIDPRTQKYLFKVFLLHRFEHLNLSNSVLTDRKLDAFLNKNGHSLKVLDLRRCSHLTDKSITLINNHCKGLEKLYLSYFEKIRKFSITRILGEDFPVQLPQLKILHLSNCPNLTSVRIEALELTKLKIDNNPSLIKGFLEAPKCVIFPDPLPFRIEWGMLSQIEKLPFGKQKWEEYFGDIGDEPPLPANIQQILSDPCPFLPNKKVYQTHVLVLIPRTVNGRLINLTTLGELVKNPLKGNATQFRSLDIGEYEDNPATHAHWTLFSREVISKGNYESYANQLNLIKQFSNYKAPNVLDAAICIFMEYVQNGIRLYSNNATNYTRCQEKYHKNWQLAIGGFTDQGLAIYSGRELVGIAAQRTFEDLIK